jgi:hypothetical protein
MKSIKDLLKEFEKIIEDYKIKGSVDQLQTLTNLLQHKKGLHKYWLDNFFDPLQGIKIEDRTVLRPS